MRPVPTSRLRPAYPSRRHHSYKPTTSRDFSISSSKTAWLLIFLVPVLVALCLQDARRKQATAMSHQEQGLMPLHMVQKPPFTVEVSGCQPVKGETIPRRHPKAQNGLLKYPAEGVDTVYNLLKRSAKVYPDEPAMGSRRLIKTHKEMKKVTKVVDGETTQVDKEWTYFELSKYSYMTYSQYWELIQKLGAGLRKLGLSKDDRLHIFATTSAQWLGMSHACVSQSMTIVTAYDTLGEEGVEHSLLQSKATAMFTDPHLLKTTINPLKKSAVKFVIYNDLSNQGVSEKQVQDFKDSHAHIKVISFSELERLGEESPVDPTPPTPEDLFCIMYTSGSTGKPKGVPISHASFIASVAGLHAVVAETVSHRDYVLAYLPLAHIFEMALEHIALFIGGTLGYGSPRTLADTSMRNCAGDMREFRPTIMVGVPQIWETVKKGVAGRVDKSGALIKSVFWGIYHLKSFLVDWNLPGQTAFDFVFNQVRAMTGGRLRFIFNGASGIADGTLHFMSMVVAPMIQGYALTETCASGALGTPLQWTGTAIGPVPAAVEVKLVSLPELNYSAESEPPQGEILIRGNAVMTEYYEDPEETRKALTPDGWFKTGDIGEFDRNGHVRVIDRVKNLVKLQGGEYIALERLEAIYKSADAVQNIMVYGDSSHARPIAIICPAEKALAETAARLGVDEHRMHGDPKVRQAVLKDLLAVGRKAGLSGMEMVTGVVLVDEEWTPANGMVTATQKVNRRAIREKFKKEIDECFGSD